MPFVLVVGLTSLAALGTSVQAPVTQVTVYSDRARVTRTGSFSVSGTQKFELPLLLDNVDPATIWVEASGAEVRRVDIAHVAAEEFPTDEARALLGKLEKSDDEIARVRGNRVAAQSVLEAIQKLRPSTPSEEPLRPLPKLNPSGWSAVFAFVGSWTDRLQGRLRELDEKLFDLELARTDLVERARIIGGAQRRAGYRVTPTLSGSGTAKVTVSYMVGNARWYPVYDLQLLPDKGQVQVSFAGRVSQETGEDWVDAAITLSTAVPATSTVVPKLFTWKIGERERFVPTPVPAVETDRPPPAPSPMPSFLRDEEVIRHRLIAALARADRGGKSVDTPKAEPENYNGTEDVDRDGDGIPDQMDVCPDDGSATDDGCPSTGKVVVQSQPSGATIKLVPGAKGDPYNVRLHQLEEQTKRMQQEVYRSRAKMQFSSGEMELRGSRGPAPAAPAAAPPPAAPPPQTVSAGDAMRTVEVLAAEPRSSFGSGWFKSEPPPPTVQVGIAAPPGYRPPVYAPDLPASLAGGYDLSFPSLRPETVRSGKGARRVALFSEAWPVSVERRLFPALAPDAFLVAEIKNPSQRVLPGGQASLFVGDDPAGTASIKVVAPAETFTLPLGLDRAVKPVRNVKLVLTEKGIISKDEINQYLVSSEVANPYKLPLKVRIVDQVPLSTDKNVEIKLLTADAGVKQDKLTGSLEWLITVPPLGKSAVNFVYTVRRPKGWRLHQ
jgi:hypothetical protein